MDTTWADQTLTDFTDHGDDVEVADDGTVTLEVPAKGWVMYAPM
ncbi:alpha-amylase domain-containing protein [Natronosalvus vescus]|nr:alpha-amylase domain-containing protein [Natronosalvus vescus]